MICKPEVAARAFVWQHGVMLEPPEPSPLKRLLFVQPNSEIGGSDIALLRTIEALRPEGLDVSVVLPGPGPLVARLESAGARVHFVPMRQLRTLPSIPYQLRYLLGIAPSVSAIAAIIRRECPQIVHTNSLYCLYGALAARSAGRPHVWHIRELAPNVPLLTKLYAAMVKKLSAHVISMTNICAERLFGIMPAHLTIMPDALDRRAWAPNPDRQRLRRELGIPPDVPLIGFVGRLDTWKGCDVFVRAAAKVAKDWPAARFLVCGGPPRGFEAYAQSLELLAKQSGAGDRMMFLGWRYVLDDMPDVMAGLDIFCHTSTRPEPFGLVLLEAMAVGTPSIAARAGGPIDIVADGTSGLLTEPGNATALAAAISRLIGDPALRKQIGDAGTARLDREFGVPQFRQRLMEVYRRALSEEQRKVSE